MCAYEKNNCKLYVRIYQEFYIIGILKRVYLTCEYTANQKSFGRKFVSITSFIHTQQIKRKNISINEKTAKWWVKKRKKSSAILYFMCTYTYIRRLVYIYEDPLTFDSIIHFFTRHSFNHRHKMKINDF